MIWTDFLACPRCLSELNQVKEALSCNNNVECMQTSRKWYLGDDDIARVMYCSSDKREYWFEIRRYNKIASELPADYCGHDESQPTVRAQIISELIQHHPTYLNIGPGFGALEQLLPEQNKICVDQSIEFLRVLQRKELPNMWLVNAFAERLPFKTDYFPCVVSDSVWTVAVDQKEYFIENARVLKPGGTFIAAVNYRWNYPRKPQQFPIDDPSLLLHFLEELGIKAGVEYHNLSDMAVYSDYEDGDYQVIMGVKE